MEQQPAKPRATDWVQEIDGWGLGGSGGGFWATGYIARIPPTVETSEIRAYFDLEVESREGILEITKVTITPGPFREGGVTTDDLRLLRLHQAARDILARVRAGTQSDWADNPDFNPGMPARDWATRFSTRPGQRGRDDLDYARVAALYVRSVESEQPVDDVAKALYLSKSQVRNILHEARQRNLLTRVGRGKAGGQLTAKAQEILRQDEDGTDDES